MVCSRKDEVTWNRSAGRKSRAAEDTGNKWASCTDKLLIRADRNSRNTRWPVTSRLAVRGASGYVEQCLVARRRRCRAFDGPSKIKTGSSPP
ncbi:hypothetical protein VFPFJ_08597 [Purpureocillium lilacinum]|uniref:Uncharacterized protein n=1 Tax=Purpureocillium lilacinum TaxID=33203 RepID=A0A179GA46_PURLI|nr:hypothetical protein VFPFJ_08597 [Purpureocillium lilacinum]OAQ74687.1 hypothetical protein VFPBJ_09982 [Purpureocillium lilacinum]OAQ82794.1 hypothetical protein VFPFJ_08597 [Purpureocillium lilacinum]